MPFRNSALAPCLRLSQPCCSGDSAVVEEQPASRRHSCDSIFEEALAERCPNANAGTVDVQPQEQNEQSPMQSPQTGRVQRHSNAASKGSNQTSDEFVQGVIRYIVVTYNYLIPDV